MTNTTREHETFTTVATADLAQVEGGIDIGAIGQQIGGLVDQLAGTRGQGAQMGGQIAGLVGSFLGR